MRPLRLEEIGGAKVARSFTMGTERVTRDRPISIDELRRMPTANRNALIDKGFIAVWPKGSGVDAVSAPDPAERFVVPLGFGRYDVVEGKKLNDGALSREAAFALAGKPLPDPKPADKPATN